MNESTPPEGYRLLTEGEIIREGDLCLICDALVWISNHSPGVYWNADEHYPMFRKMEQDSQ